jgi:uncharacterized protein
MDRSEVTFEIVTVRKPDDMNVIIGQSHFIKTVEDLHEALIGSARSSGSGSVLRSLSGTARASVR